MNALEVERDEARGVCKMVDIALQSLTIMDCRPSGRFKALSVPLASKIPLTAEPVTTMAFIFNKLKKKLKTNVKKTKKNF